MKFNCEKKLLQDAIDVASRAVASVSARRRIGRGHSGRAVPWIMALRAVRGNSI